MPALSVILREIGKLLPKDVHYEAFADAVDYQGAPPQIVAFPTVERYDAPHGVGGDGIGNPRRLRTRVCTVEFHLWHETQDATEVLLDTLAQAINDLTFGSWQFEAGEWKSRGVGGFGYAYVLIGTFDVPLSRATDQTVVITSSPITQEFIES